MRNQIGWNIVSLLVSALICVSLVYIPSEKSICCHGIEWELGFLWLETFLMSICFFYVLFCLIFLWRNEKSQRLKVLLSSKVLFEMSILLLFLLCNVSNTSVLAGIDISFSNTTEHDDTDINHIDEFPKSFIPHILIHILRVLVAALLTLWIFVYDLNYLPLEGRNKKCSLQFRRCMHGFLIAMALYQALRFGIMVFFWPHVMSTMLEKTDHDELYTSITLPVSNMFWLRCFFKLWQSEPNGTTHHEHTDEPINVHHELANRTVAIILKQMNIRLGLTVVTALSLVGIMYAIQLLDKSDQVYTGCSYGLFRLALSTLFILTIIITYARRLNGEIAVFEIHFHGVEMFQFFLFFLAKISVNVLNSIWFSSNEHHEGGCRVPAISVVAQIGDAIFNLSQFICLLRTSNSHWLLRSSLFYLLIGINCGLIWFDLSAEALHLKHFTEEYEDLHQQMIFLAIQAIFWMGLEYHILVVELLVTQRLENPFKRPVFDEPAPVEIPLHFKDYSHTVPPNFFRGSPKETTTPNPFSKPARSNSNTHLLV